MGKLVPIIIGIVIVGMYLPFTADAVIEPTPIVFEQDFEWEKRVILIGTEITWTPERIEQEVREVFHETPNTAVAVFKCESELKPDAYNGSNTNGSNDTGIAQINSVHDTTGYDLYDVQDNLKFAKKLYDSDGWLPWVCFNKNLWQKHL